MIYDLRCPERDPASTAVRCDSIIASLGSGRTNPNAAVVETPVERKITQESLSSLRERRLRALQITLDDVIEAIFDISPEASDVKYQHNRYIFELPDFI